MKIPSQDLRFRAVRSSGPGGQNVNKVATKVELRFDLPGTEALTGAQKARLRQLAANRLDADGWLVITSQATRSQTDNREDARARLGDLIQRCLRPPKVRRPSRPTKASKRRRLNDKRKRSDVKRSRQRPGRDD